MSIVDLIFPKRCVGCGSIGSYICHNCYSKIEFVDRPVCPICQRQAVSGRTHPGCWKKLGLNGLAVGARYKGAVREAIGKVKYKFVQDIESVLAEVLCKNLWRFDIPHNFLLVPIPLHRKRENWRGFNQSKLLVLALSKKYKVKFSDLLVRKVETRTQVGLSKEERAENVKGIFGISEGVNLKGKNVLLVDDVFTSGSTAKEACRVLKRAGAGEVWALTIALG